MTCAILIAAMLLALLPMTTFADVKTENQKPSEEMIKSLAKKYLNERNRILVSSSPNSYPMLLNVSTIKASEMSRQLAARQMSDIEKMRTIRKKVEDQGCRFWNRFETKVEIENITVAPDKTVARIYEYTRLYFGPDYLIPGKGECSSFDAERDFTFVHNGARWIISDVKVTNPGTMPPPNEPSVKPVIPSPEDYRRLTREPIPEEEGKVLDGGQEPPVSPYALKGFSGQAIVDYCNMYAENPNTEWYPYWWNADCTNFISQALHYAGWEYRGWSDWSIFAWYCNRYTWPWVWFRYTNTWVNATWWKVHALVTERGQDTIDYNGLRVGDVVQIDMDYPANGVLDHSMIVSRNDAWHYTGKFISQHTENRHDYPLVDVLESWPNTIYWWSLTRTY